MITELESPDKVVALRTVGKITKEDIQKLEPLFEKYVQKYGELLLYMEVVDFGYSSAEAFWEDLKTCTKYFGDCKKIALATENEWIGKLSNFLGKITPIEIQVFHLGDHHKAFAWMN